MLEIRETETFSKWFAGLADERAKVKIAARIDRLALGNPGDVAPVGDGDSEMRIHYGPGYRVYFVQHADIVAILLCAGSKKTQRKNISIAIALAADLET